MTVRIKKLLKNMPQLNNPLLIEGLPGIGNVGKIAVDFLIDELGAKKIMDISSYSFPHSVFVNEENVIELPIVEIYLKKFKNKKQDLLFLAGDVQPTEEEGSYEFSHKVLDIAQDFGVKQIVTIGGIGLPTVPEKPKVYCTGSSKETINRYKKGIKVNDKLSGVVGPIVGVTGLLVGLAPERNMEAVCLLAETHAHPLYLGIKGGQEVLKIIDKKLGLKLDLKSLDKEIKEVEEELIKKTKQLADVKKKSGRKKDREVSYIG